MPEVTLTPNQPNAEKNYQILKIKGEIDRDTIAHYKEQMEAFLATFISNNLVLDLSELEFTNSEGIGYTTDIYNRLMAQNKKVLIINASARIMDIFNLVGLNQLIQCFSSETEAANSL